MAETGWSLSIIVAVLTTFGGFLAYKWYRKSGTHGALLFSFVSFFLALAPIISLFFYKDMFNENDRYTYFASLFFYYFLIKLIDSFSHVLKLPALILVIGMHLYYGFNQRTYAIQAGKAYHSLVDNFPEIHFTAFMIF